jgi:hypothetical protein
MNVPEWLAPWLFASLCAGVMVQLVLVVLLLIALYRLAAHAVRAISRRLRQGGTLPPPEHDNDRAPTALAK